MVHREAKNKSSRKTKAVHHDPDALPSLMANPQEKLAVSLPLRLIIRLALGFVDLFHIWRFPRKTDGCFEHMTLIDKLHWLYKSANPIRLAEKNLLLRTFSPDRRKPALRCRRILNKPLKYNWLPWAI